MIELRWGQPAPMKNLDDGTPVGPVGPILQFRQQELTFPARTVLEFQEGASWRWTEWQDVPTVLL